MHAVLASSSKSRERERGRRYGDRDTRGLVSCRCAMAAAILGSMSVGKISRAKPDGATIVVPTERSRARRDEDNTFAALRVDSGPAPYQRHRPNRL